jgi:hypothetical protein
MKNTSDLFVVLSADGALSESLSAALPSEASFVVASSYASLLELAKKPGVIGMVVDARSITGRVESKVERLRNDAPLAHILFVADELTANVLNELQPLRVDIVARPLPAEAIAVFVERALTAGRLPNASVNAYIDQLASAHRLNGKEVSLFSVVLDNETPEQACARLGLDEAVYVRTMRRLLKKCHMRSADRLAKNVMRDALLSTRALTASLVEPFTAHAVGM